MTNNNFGEELYRRHSREAHARQHAAEEAGAAEPVSEAAREAYLVRGGAANGERAKDDAEQAIAAMRERLKRLDARGAESTFKPGDPMPETFDP